MATWGEIVLAAVIVVPALAAIVILALGPAYTDLIRAGRKHLRLPIPL